MYIHIGMGKSVRDDEIIGIFDLDTSTVSKRTRDFLNRAEKEKKVSNKSQDIPRTFILCDESGKEKIYLSQISGNSLLKKKNKKKEKY